MKSTTLAQNWERVLLFRGAELVEERGELASRVRAAVDLWLEFACRANL